MKKKLKTRVLAGSIAFLLAAEPAVSGSVVYAEEYPSAQGTATEAELQALSNETSGDAAEESTTGRDPADDDTVDGNARSTDGAGGAAAENDSSDGISAEEDTANDDATSNDDPSDASNSEALPEKTVSGEEHRENADDVRTDTENPDKTPDGSQNENTQNTTESEASDEKLTETAPDENTDLADNANSDTETVSGPETVAADKDISETETASDSVLPPEDLSVVEDTLLPAEEVLAEETGYTLSDGAAIIPADADTDTVKQILAEALIEGDCSGLEYSDLEWEYYCEGKSGLLKNSAWGSIEGFTSKKMLTTYTHPALKDNTDGSYRLRLKGTEAEATLTKESKEDSSIRFTETPVLSFSYQEDGSIDYTALYEAIFACVETEPAGLGLEDVEISYWAGSTTLGGKDAWVPLEGKKGGTFQASYPSIPAGESKTVRVMVKETEAYFSSSAETSVMIKVGKTESQIALNENASVKLDYPDGQTVDTDKARRDIFDAVVASSTPTDLCADDVEITYYATAASGSVGELGKSWVPLEGGKSGLLTYPAISAGTQQIRISFPGNLSYLPVTVETSVEVIGRSDLTYTLKEGPYTVSMIYGTTGGYDYAATGEAIWNAVFDAEGTRITAQDMLVEYNIATDALPIYKPLDNQDALSKKFGAGDWKIRFSWSASAEYNGGSVDVNITATDDRSEALLVLNSDASITYNMDIPSMKQAVLDNVIDWENSSLPAKESLQPDQLKIEYYATAKTGALGELGKGWTLIEGGKGTELAGAALEFPHLGAGEGQKIRISFSGNEAYRPAESVETTLNVKKAKASVKVFSNNIHVGDALPKGFVSVAPNDEFNVYTIYAGATSDVTTALYLELPQYLTDNWVLKMLDPIVEGIFGKSFSRMMNDGVTVGELRRLFSTQELLDVLDKLNIDTGTFGAILNAINKLPGIADSARIGFGVPNRAGLYTVVAVSDSKNYETAVGMGFLLVRMHLKGVNLSWNQEMSGKKLTAAQAKDFDFGVTLSKDGDVSIDQSNVHYLYSGFTSKWRAYSSTTTPPSEPGSYVVTVVTLGGNYQAAPITRSFKITK